MKNIFALFILLSLALLPIHSHSQGNADIQSDIDSFVAQHPFQAPSVLLARYVGENNVEAVRLLKPYYNSIGQKWLDYQLNRAVRSGYSQMVAELIQIGADVNNTNDTKTPLEIICSSKSKGQKTEVYNLLVTNGAKDRNGRHENLPRRCIIL